MAKEPTTKRKPGRPPAELDEQGWRYLDSMCKAHVTQNDICSVLDINRKTLNLIIKREKGVTFAEYREAMLGEGRAAVLAKQMELCMNGDKTMLIWWGKQYLGQRDCARQVIETPKAQGSFTISLKA